MFEKRLHSRDASREYDMADGDVSEDPADSEEEQRKEARRTRSCNMHIDIPAGQNCPVLGCGKALDISCSNVKA